MDEVEWIRMRRYVPTILIVVLFLVNNAWSQTGTFTEIIPQIAIGSFDGGATKYSTVIEIINSNVISVSVSANFFNEDGSATNLNFTTNSPTIPTITSGTLASLTLDPSKVLVISGGTTPGTTPSSGTALWGKIVTDSPVTIVMYLELRTATNALRSRISMPASPSNMAKFVIPRIRNVDTGLDVAFAVVNTAPTFASLTVTLKAADGSTLGNRILTISGNSHRALFTQDFFALTNEPTGTNFQYIVFDAGTASQFAASALAFEGGNQTTFPVDVLR
jgi:hypothetical protein